MDSGLVREIFCLDLEVFLKAISFLDLWGLVSEIFAAGLEDGALGRQGHVEVERHRSYTGIRIIHNISLPIAYLASR